MSPPDPVSFVLRPFVRSMVRSIVINFCAVLACAGVLLTAGCSDDDFGNGPDLTGLSHGDLSASVIDLANASQDQQVSDGGTAPDMTLLDGSPDDGG